MDKFDSIFAKHVDSEEIEQLQESVEVPVVYNFADLWRLKKLPLRFDKQDHNEPSLRYKYVLETKEEYQLSATTLVEQGTLELVYNCLDLEYDDVPSIAIVWKINENNLKLVPTQVKEL